MCLLHILGTSVPVVGQSLTAMSWQPGSPTAGQNFTTLSLSTATNQLVTMKTALISTQKIFLCEFGNLVIWSILFNHIKTELSHPHASIDYRPVANVRVRIF
jgi:hypothetical protein